MGEKLAFVHEATLRLRDDVDPAAVGAEVTRSLCGHWEHEGPCRWPHNNELEATESGVSFRTLFISADAEADEVRRRIERTLSSDHRWEALAMCARELNGEEQTLAQRLLQAP